MQVAGRKVAVVGMGGAFPACSGLDEFNRKMFTDQSLVREWDLAVQYNKQIRSTVSGFITEAEMGLEAVWAPITEKYPETYIETLGRIPDGNLSTADMGSIWAMIGAQEAVKMAGDEFINCNSPRETSPLPDVMTICAEPSAACSGSR